MATTDSNAGQQNFRNADLKESDMASTVHGAQKPSETSTRGNASNADLSVNMEFLLDICFIRAKKIFGVFFHFMLY